MQGRVPSVLTAQEQEAIEGGDLLLSVNRDVQMMTVTRINPGNYDNIQCYTVKVTTSVTRQAEVEKGVPKGAMENPARVVAGANLKQFPATTATVLPVTKTQPEVVGPVIRTTATQQVTVAAPTPGESPTRSDSGYNIHYVDPAKGSNTLGCIGVQSQAGMDKIVASLAADNKSYSDPSQAKQTVTVSAYTNGVIPPASTFKATETKSAAAALPPSVLKPAPAPAASLKPAPDPAPKASLKPTPAPAPASKPWYQFW